MMRYNIPYRLIAGVFFLCYFGVGSASVLRTLNAGSVQVFQQDKTASESNKNANLTATKGSWSPLRFLAFIANIVRIFHLPPHTLGNFRAYETTVEFMTCRACVWIVYLIQKLVASGRSIFNLSFVVVKLCSFFGIMPKPVCEDFVKHQVDLVLYLFAKSPHVGEQEACSVYLATDCYFSSFHFGTEWGISLPPTPKPPLREVSLPKPGLPKFRVLQISDTHFDLNYKENANADCGLPLCCQDIHPNTDPTKMAGKWGDLRTCDIPVRTVENMLEFISKNIHIDYIVWTGDIPPHTLFNDSKEAHLSLINTTVQLIIQYFPNIPVFPAIGNHESYPINSFPPSNSDELYNMAWLYDEIKGVWSYWLPAYTMDTINRDAFYSVLVTDKLRIISINTNYCIAQNWWLYLNDTDPANQLEWLIQELQMAEDNGEKVHIIGHVPPGSEDCRKTWGINYYKIINRYESTVLAQFFGHNHVDEFQLFFDKTDLPRATNVAFGGPSVTTYIGFNPAFKIYTIDGNYQNSSYAVLDFETYMMDLVDANERGEPQWTKLYSAKEAYGLPSLRPEDWNNLVNRMKTDDNLFAKYYKHYHRASPVFPHCNYKCRWQLICNMKSEPSNDRCKIT